MNRLFLLFLLLQIFGSLRAQDAFVCRGQYFLSLRDSTATDDNERFKLYELFFNENTQEITYQVVHDDIPYMINGIGFSNADYYIYGVHPREFWLVRFNRLGQDFILDTLALTPGNRYVSGDVTPDGRYLVLLGLHPNPQGGLFQELAFVDLQSPVYAVDIVQLSGDDLRAHDLYITPDGAWGYSFNRLTSELVKIDMETGEIVEVFSPSEGVDTMGALFGNPYGDLFGYGREEQGQLQDRIYRVDKETGEVSFFSMTIASNASDGCSCPYSLEFKKTVRPEIALACTDITYTFYIDNFSQREQTGVQLLDQMPPGFVIDTILYLPYTGEAVSAEGTGLLDLQDLTIPPGQDSVIVRVSVGDISSGIYGNQAQLDHLPFTLGTTRASDDPGTAPLEDSTFVEIIGLPGDTLWLNEAFCTGDSLLLDLSIYGNSYNWTDSLNTPTRWISAPGTYEVAVENNCKIIRIFIEIEEQQLEAFFEPPVIDICLGDSLQLDPTVYNSGNQLQLIWNPPPDSYLDCDTCLSPLLYTLDTGEAELLVENEAGCRRAATLLVRVDKSRPIFFPNAFSPNFDGINDRFYPLGKPPVSVEFFEIFDRWGNLLHRAENGSINDPAMGWDGHARGKALSAGVYVYQARLRFADGVTETYSGSVMLMR